MSSFNDKTMVRGQKQIRIPSVPGIQFDEIEHMEFSRWVIENKKVIDELEKFAVVPSSLSKTEKPSTSKKMKK